MVGQTHAVSSGEHYYISPFHRTADPTDDKCIWTIPYDGELQCFDNAIINNWIVFDSAWGIQANSLDNLDELGINYERKTLVIAKFIRGGASWHGYPADIRRKPKDRPNHDILDKWRASNLISKNLRAKIQGGRI